ncbi:MAG: redoxin domain-containing protein [Phycisphaerae bacterium]|nr:redoxin domain-containing protein [Phycisphaerae bacterium]
MAELRGLGAVNEELGKRGGTVIAICADPPAKSRDVRRKNKIAFPILNDPGLKLSRAFGLLHEKGSPTGEDIALPAQYLFDAKGGKVWEFHSTRANERVDPKLVLAEIAKL